MEPITPNNNPIQIPFPMDGMPNNGKGLLDFIRTLCKEGKAWVYVFLDSQLGSPGEIQFRKMVAEMVIRTLAKISPDILKDKDLAPLIVEYTETILDRIKLRYHFEKGWLSESDYIAQKVKHSVTLVCTVVNKLEKQTIPLLKEYIYEAFPEYADMIIVVLSWFEDKIELSPQRAEELLKEWYCFKMNVYNRAKQIWKGIVDFVDERVIPAIAKVKEKLNKKLKKYA